MFAGDVPEVQDALTAVGLELGRAPVGKYRTWKEVLANWTFLNSDSNQVIGSESWPEATSEAIAALEADSKELSPTTPVLRAATACPVTVPS